MTALAPSTASIRHPRTVVTLLVAVLALAADAPSGATEAGDAQLRRCSDQLRGLQPRPALEAVRNALDQHRIVFLGERHGTSQLHSLYRAILSDATVRSRFQDLFVEFLTSEHQGLLDRYLLDLEPMTFEQLAPTWRDVPGIILEQGDDLSAHRLLLHVRGVNEELEAAERIRVLGGDSVIRWESVADQRDWGTRLNRRDRRFLEVLWDEVLDRGRKAIAILGRGHVKRLDPSPNNWINLVELVEARAEERAYVFHVLAPPLNDLPWSAPSVLPVAGTCLADLRLEAEAPEMRYGDQIDAVLFVGSNLVTEERPPFPAEFRAVLERRKLVIQ